MMMRLQRGFTLLEVLITVIILAVGLLGLAALHNLALTNAQGSHHHTLATAFAYDALDRIRAGENPGAVQASFADPRVSGSFPGGLNANIAVGGDGNVTVTLNWADERLGDGGESSQNQVVVRSRI